MDLSSLFKKKDLPAKASAPARALRAGGQAGHTPSILGAQKLFKGSVVTRIAPSPTGPLHIGTARSALFNFLYAKHHNGKFILRIEDTDTARSKKEYEKDIIEGLSWLGLTPDETYRQSDRTLIYQSYISQLLEGDKAYISKEKSKNDSTTNVEVIRLRNPNIPVEFDDMLRGVISFDTTELGDFVIAKSKTEPLYHLAVVIDDYEMKISHVIRGEDHISNTPRQILIQYALGFPRPQYAHIPLILSKDRSKMSKRAGGVSIQELKKDGYLPEAVINYLALLGWNPGGYEERFTLHELIEMFDINNIQHGGAVYDVEKLNWFNRQSLQRVSKPQFKRMVENAIPQHLKELPTFDPKVVERLIPVLREKIKSLNDIARMSESGDFDYFFIKPTITSEQLLWKDDTDHTQARKHLQEVYSYLEHIPTKSFKVESIKKAVWEYAEKHGRGSVLWPMRFALSGRDKSPDPFTLAHVLGKKEALERIEAAAQRIISEKHAK